MDFEELLELLEIDTLDEFAYFEHFAALIECDEDIPYEMFFKVLASLETETLIDLTDNFFEDILSGVPDESIDIFTLLSTIRQALLGLAKASSSHEDRILYVDELFKFRNWYMFDSIVYCKRIIDNVKKEITISEALALKRLERLNEDKYSYDFSDCLDYEIDEYSMPLDATIDQEYEEIIEEDEELYENGLIDPLYPVIDGEDLDKYDKEEEY